MFDFAVVKIGHVFILCFLPCLSRWENYDFDGATIDGNQLTSGTKKISVVWIHVEVVGQGESDWDVG